MFLPSPMCAEYTRANFTPSCLPQAMQSYSFLGGGVESPYIYNAWMFAEACGLECMQKRMMEYHQRRYTISRAVAIIIQNWWVYALGVLLASFIMNIFFIAPPRRRCCGLFAEDSDAYHKCLQPVYYILFILALVVMLGIAYQFVRQQIQLHSDMRGMKGGVIQGLDGTQFYVEKPDRLCKTVLWLEWPAHKELLQTFMLFVFTLMDNLNLSIWICYTQVIGCVGVLRACCCCCGCLCTRAWAHKPWCCWPKHCVFKICFCWWLCQPVATCCFFVSVVLLLGTYFAAGLMFTLCAYGAVIVIIAAVFFVIEYSFRKFVECTTRGKCRVLPLLWRQYVKVLFPMPLTSAPGPRAAAADPAADPESEDAELLAKARRHRWETQVMGVSHHSLTWAFPWAHGIVVLPLTVLIALPFLTFVFGDALIDTLAWSKCDMAWFTAKLEPNVVGFIFAWYWQAFKCLWGGVTDAFELVLWTWPNHFFDHPGQVFDDLTTMFEHGLNPGNLLSHDFLRFESSVFFWRFVIVFVYTCCRMTAMINGADVTGDMDNMD